jgi:U3 small nucleolar RNA-associated protein 23
MIFFVTRSSLVELEKLMENDPIFAEARQFGLDECEIIELTNESNDDAEKHSPSEDIKTLVKDGNKNGYFVASQDKALSAVLRDMTFVPQMWLTKGVLIFDTPSAASRKASQREEREKQKSGGGTMTVEESELVQRLRQERINERRETNAANHGDQARKKRKAKGPNPLSCKKTKKGIEETGEKKKRRRRNKAKSEE